MYAIRNFLSFIYVISISIFIVWTSPLTSILERLIDFTKDPFSIINSFSPVIAFKRTYSLTCCSTLESGISYFYWLENSTLFTADCGAVNSQGWTRKCYSTQMNLRTLKCFTQSVMCAYEKKSNNHIFL